MKIKINLFTLFFIWLVHVSNTAAFHKSKCIIPMSLFMTNWINPLTSFPVNKSIHVDDRNLMARQEEGICYRVCHLFHTLPSSHPTIHCSQERPSQLNYDNLMMLSGHTVEGNTSPWELVNSSRPYYLTREIREYENIKIYPRKTKLTVRQI